MTCMDKLIFSIFAILIFSCKGKRESTKPVTENITESVYASGLIKAKNQYQVFSTVSGIINKRLVAENDLVRVGTPLFEISDMSVTLNRANASLAASYADLSANKEKLAEAKNNISIAQRKFDNDSLLYQRQKNLWSEHIGTKIELEQRELAYKNSKTVLNSANMGYSDLRKELDFRAKQARTNLAISEYHESDFVIKSALEGRVYSLTKERGETVNPQAPLAIIGDASLFFVELQIDENDIVRIKLGQTVLLTMDSYRDRVFEAKLSKLYPLLNDLTRTFTAEAEFIKQPEMLFPNLTAEANIVIRSKANVLTIPRNYLIDDTLVIIKNNKMKRVVTGLKDYQKVEIIQGITANDIIYNPEK